MSEEMWNPLEIERVLDYVIALFPDENDQESVGEHTHNERKVDKAIRLIERGDRSRSTERAIKIVYYGDPIGRMFNDRISIEFSPSELSSLAIHFKRQALDAKDYGAQTEMREMRESFGRAYDLWDEYKRVNK